MAADPEALLRAETAALGWLLASEQHRAEGRSPDAAALIDASRELCARHGIDGRAGMAEWRRENGCTAEDVERLLETRASAAGAARLAPAALDAVLLDYLRWTGDYAALLARARRA